MGSEEGHLYISEDGSAISASSCREAQDSSEVRQTYLFASNEDNRTLLALKGHARCAPGAELILQAHQCIAYDTTLADIFGSHVMLLKTISSAMAPTYRSGA
jgi:hypothetical protein